MSLHDIPILYQDILPDAHMYRCYECSWQCSHGDLNNTPAYRLTHPLRIMLSSMIQILSIAL